MGWATSTIRRLFSREEGPLDPERFWSERAQRLGPCAVLDARHPADQADAVTEMQRRELFPRLRDQLDGTERRGLDYGCGPARFSADLAAAIGGRAIGLDICPELLALAPRSPRVDFARVAPGRIPLARGSVDVAWVCLVLGGIVDPQTLAATAGELERVLAPRGLLFLVENTSPRRGVARHWRLRSVDDYRSLFPTRALAHLGDYDDAGDRISILAGRGACQE